MAFDSSSHENDPVTTGSLGWPLVISTALLVASTVWALYDEAYSRRPWKDYQARFVEAYGDHLKPLGPVQADKEKEIRETEEFQALEQELAAAEAAATKRIAEIDRELNKRINLRIALLTGSLQELRSEVTALVYRIEVARDKGKKERLDKLNKELDEVKGRQATLTLPGGEEGEATSFDFDYEKLTKAYDDLKATKVRLLREKAELTGPAAEIRARRDEFLKRRLGGLTASQIAGLQGKMDLFEPGIKQIHVADVNLVDRCETCHLGIREPLELTADDMGGERAFVSHPRRELLKIHDPEQFGCSPCHGGNGVATRSKTKAHGRYTHWPWPLFDAENTEAGCLQCHEGTLQLEHAEVLNQGSKLFRHRGCWACHPRDGFDTERSQLQEVSQSLRSVADRRAAVHQAIADAEGVADDYDSTDEQVLDALAAQETLTLELSGLDTEEQQHALRRRSLYMERKNVAPNLKDIRAKVRPAWLPAWLEDPRQFRPTTRMPHFRLPPDQLEAIAAFVWQAGLEPRIEAQPPGNPETGETLFDKRGCLGCHSLGLTDEEIPYGSSFSVDLSRIGEKVNYDYLVRWILNPRERTLPYCATCGRDVTQDDYEKAGIAFAFDVDHSRCPVCDHEMQVQNQTVMPVLRLTPAEARDIASFLMTLKDPDADYPEVDYLDDTGLFAKGKQLVAHYGCMGCHEIAGTETLGKIGTDLTEEGSKPIERLDFALLTHDAKKIGWYNHKGFFEHKLRDSSEFDQGKEKGPLEKLRMPDFGLRDDQITALTTFLLGSVTSQFPARYYHNPTGSDEDIQAGWWVLEKYNCVGCHEIVPGVKPPIQALEQYADEKAAQAPPSLVGEGARVDPAWLVEFLRNPALSRTDVHRNGVRPYLDVRMPTFTLSEGEISKLVRFFNAISNQSSPYLEPTLTTLTDAERKMARDVFKAAECLKCHAGGDPSAFTEETIAPNFVLAKDRLKPRWMERWMVDPARLIPGTQMPTGLFERQDDRWILTAGVPESMTDYPGDHVDLFVRYMQEFTPAEAAQIEAIEAEPQ